MGFFRFIKYRYLVNRRRKYASFAVSLALAHASFGQVKYKSVGNGMADITLALEEDHKFRLDFYPVEEEKKYVMKGKWVAEDGDFVLKFKRVKLDIYTLFNSNTGFHKSSQIEDKKTVRIPRSLGGIMIWGIYCVRDNSDSSFA